MYSGGGGVGGGRKTDLENIKWRTQRRREAEEEKEQEGE